MANIEMGQKLPGFELPDETEKSWDLSEHLGNGPVMLVFYRGDW